MSDATIAAASPVTAIPTDVAEPLDPRPALCLSGGGYRAMVFHIGALWRLYETGLLGGARGVSRISSVSGGSITAGFLARQWSTLHVNAPDVAGRFIPNFVTPLRALAAQTIDEGAVLIGLMPGVSAADRIADAYDRYLFHGSTCRTCRTIPAS
jgi:NTE family protein